MYEKDLCEDTRPRKQTKMLELTVKILATFYMSEDRSRSNLMANKYLLDSTYRISLINVPPSIVSPFLKKLSTWKKEHYSNFCAYEIATF